MRKQRTRLICVALLAASLAALGLAGTALGRVGKARLFSFIKSVSAENSAPDQLIHTSGIPENRKVVPAQSIPPEVAGTRSENSRGNKFCEQIQLTDCLT